MKKMLTVVCLCVVIIGLVGIIPSALASTVKKPVVAADKGLSQFTPKEIKLDRNHDGVVDRIEVYDAKGVVIRVEADTTNNGKNG